jgi:hypothetical protein
MSLFSPFYNHRLAAEVTIRDIMGRHKAITDRGSVDSAAHPTRIENRISAELQTRRIY